MVHKKVTWPIITGLLLILIMTSTIFAGESKSDQAFKLYNIAMLENNIHKKANLLKKAYQLNPENGKICFRYGKVLLKMNKSVRAEMVFNKAAKDPQLEVRVYRYLSDYYYRKKDLVKANFYLKKLVTIKEEDNYLNNYRLGELNGIKGLRNHHDAIKYYKRAYQVRRYKDNHDILYYIAQNYYTLADYDNAIKYLKKYPHTNKNNQKAFKLLIQAYNRAKNKKEVAYHLEQYLKIWPYDRWANRVAQKVGVRAGTSY